MTRRGSARIVRRTGHERLWITFHRGGWEVHSSSTRAAPSKAAGVSPLGLLRAFHSLARQSATNKSKGAAVIRVIRVKAASGSKRPGFSGGGASRAWRVHRVALHSFDSFAGSRIELVSTTAAMSSSSCQQWVATAPLGGCFETSWLRRSPVGGIAPSTGRITPAAPDGAARFSFLQPTVNWCGVWGHVTARLCRVRLGGSAVFNAG